MSDRRAIEKKDKAEEDIIDKIIIDDAVIEKKKTALKKASFVIDGTFEGFMCSLNLYYHGGYIPEEIVCEDAYQQSLDGVYVKVETEVALAQKISDAIYTKMSDEVFQIVYNAFHNADRTKYIDIFKFIVKGFSVGGSIIGYNNLDFVLSTKKLSSATGREVMHLKQFLRFIEAEDGTLYAVITPLQDTLPLLIGHFMDRFKYQRWIIHDTNHGIAAIYDTKKCIFVEAPDKAIFVESAEERMIQDLWRTFFNSIAIKERLNKAGQRNHLPMKYRKNMTEFNPLSARTNANLKLGQERD